MSLNTRMAHTRMLHTRRSSLGISSMLIALTVAASSLSAQDSGTSAPPQRNHLQTDPAVYERYTRPGQCQIAAFRAERYYARDNTKDTLAINPLTDTLPGAAAAVGKACGAKFQINTVAFDQLIPLVHLYLYSREPERAWQASLRLRNESRSLPPAQRGRLLLDLVSVYFQAKPKYLSEMNEILADLDSMGAPAAEARREAHTFMSQSATNWNDFGKVVDEGELSVLAWSQMSTATRSDEVAPMSRQYNTLADANRLRKGVEAGSAVVERARPDLLTTREPGSMQYQMIQNWIQGFKTNYPFYGARVRPIQSPHWFNTKGDTSARPKPGVVTMIIFTEPQCGHSCYPVYSMIRRWNEKYSARGFEIVVVAKTNGFFRNQLTLDPAVEVELIRKFFLEYHKLPVTLAVPETQFSRIHDGRRVPEPSLNDQGWPQGDVLVVDREGNFSIIGSRYTATMQWMMLEDQIEQLLAK